MKKRFVVSVMFVLPVILATVGLAARQAPAPEISFPVLPAIIDYRLAPYYFLQFINDSPQYSLIEATVGKQDPPVCVVVLTEKTSLRRSYYSNSQERVKTLGYSGHQAYFAKIDYRVIKNIGSPATYGFAFVTERGQAIRWRFIPAAEPSERGAGLTEQFSGAGLQLRYREAGTTAGAGTAVQIGERVSEAEPWPEVSSPPYFIAHRGFYIENMHVCLLQPGSEKWRVTAGPPELNEGAKWTLADEKGQTRVFQIASRKGDELTIVEAVPQKGDDPAVTIKARIAPRGLALREVLVSHDNQQMRMTFKPELALSQLVSGGKPGEVAFQIDLGKHEKVAVGSITAEARAGAVVLKWQAKSPDWAKAHPVSATIGIDAAGYSIEAR